MGSIPITLIITKIYKKFSAVTYSFSTTYKKLSKKIKNNLKKVCFILKLFYLCTVNMN